MGNETPKDFSELCDDIPVQEDLETILDGMTPDEYIAKLTEEMDAMEFDSIPFDRSDYIVAFSLALLEVAGDFFIADPGYSKSLANKLSDKNNKLGEWMNKIHENIEHNRQPIDYLGKDYGGTYHRGKSFGHDSLPLARILYSSKIDEKDSSGTKATKKTYNGFLLARDIIMTGFAIYQISSGQFIDCSFTKSDGYKLIISEVTHRGGEYESCNVFVAVFKLIKHLIADFFSETSLPIPGFSILTHWPDRDVEAFAMKLYKNGMNLRTMFLGGIPVGLIEIIMHLYVHSRYHDSEYSENQKAHKLNKMLLISHEITSAINMGKVIITKNPARLNIILIARTCNLIWQVIRGEMELTNKALTKYEMGVLKNRIESMQTLILLDKTMYQIRQHDKSMQKIYDGLLQIRNREQTAQDFFDTDFNDVFSQIK